MRVGAQPWGVFPSNRFTDVDVKPLPPLLRTLVNYTQGGQASWLCGLVAERTSEVCRSRRLRRHALRASRTPLNRTRQNGLMPVPAPDMSKVAAACGAAAPCGRTRRGSGRG